VKRSAAVATLPTDRMESLPIDSFIPRIVDDVRRARAAVVTAAPGAGKTTRVPPALMDEGPVIVLQPRRVAARAIAARIAAERGWTVGREAGWQVRQDRNFSAATKLLVVTEGILTARLQTDPLLSEFRTIVLDEFHERSIHADVAIALAKQAWRARTDLRIVVMSATLDSAAVATFLDGCPVIDVPGRTFPLEIAYRPGESVADAAVGLLRATDGSVLCFLPGAREIDRAVADIRARVDRDAEVLPLHGSLDADAQDAAIRPSDRRRVIVATNIAETSVTVPGITAVLDSGLQKVARYDAERGIDTLETERITGDAADQRAGRAGRVAPGTVRRLWDPLDRLRPHREPDIHRVDLSSAVLDIVGWGGSPKTLEWFEPPRWAGIDAAMTLLERLGLIADGRLTAIGEQAKRLSMHPRLARVALEGRGSRAVQIACDRLTERRQTRLSSAATTSDVLSLIEDVKLDVGEAAFRRAIAAGYPDRVARRREPRSPNVLLSSGTGATIGRESGVHDAEFLVAVDITSGIVRMASAVDREWLKPTSSELEHRFDAEKGTVRAATVVRYDAIVLSETPAKVDPDEAAEVLARAWLSRDRTEAEARLFRRLRFAAVDVELPSLAFGAAYGAKTIDNIRIEPMLPPDAVRRLERDAPDSLVVPSGRTKAIDYNEDGTVSVSVKLQELFGLAETPRIGPRKEPVVLSLLAPNGRPVQVTRDLRSFWDRTYPEVRKELRARYPKHPWPEDPWNATPTARTTRRKS
jgi:ATP-dependent helicase HrpB